MVFKSKNVILKWIIDCIFLTKLLAKQIANLQDKYMNYGGSRF